MYFHDGEGLSRKLYVPHIKFLEFWLELFAPFLAKLNFLANLKWYTFLHDFI